jgi:sporulation protein YlmC with PRC-barrel domain
MRVRGDIDLGLGILDHQLLDSEGRRCGKVDDLELDGVAGGRPRVSFILVGGAAWSGRGRLGRLAAWLGRSRTARIPWDDVAGIDSGVRLRRTAQELRLGRGDDRARRWIERVPGSSL